MDPASDDAVVLDEVDEDERERPPYRDGVLHVLAAQCSTCVFRPGNLMALRPGRLAGMIAASLDGGPFACHATLYADHGEALCRGLVDRYGTRIVAIRLARALDIVVEDPVPPGV